MVSKRSPAPIACLGIVALVLASTCNAAAPTAASDLAPAVEAASGGLEEIIVTAQKQTEDLQRTAVAITSISEDSLVSSCVHDSVTAQILMPSVRFQTEGASTE